MVQTNPVEKEQTTWLRDYNKHKNNIGQSHDSESLRSFGILPREDECYGYQWIHRKLKK